MENVISKFKSVQDLIDFICDGDQAYCHNNFLRDIDIGSLIEYHKLMKDDVDEQI